MWPTVDGRNPAPVDMVNIPLMTRFHICQVVQGVFHQQYFQLLNPDFQCWFGMYIPKIQNFQICTPISWICRSTQQWPIYMSWFPYRLPTSKRSVSLLPVVCVAFSTKPPAPPWGQGATVEGLWVKDPSLSTTPSCNNPPPPKKTGIIGSKKMGSIGK